MALWPSCVLVLLSLVVSTQAQGVADVLGIIPESQTFQCLNISSIEICSQIGYSMGSFPNWRDQNSLQVANQELNNFLPIIQRVCSEAFVHLLCSVYAPFCEPARPDIRLPPCRELCDYVRAGCEDELMGFGFMWPPVLSCDRYPTLAETRLSYCPPNVTDLRIPPNIEVNRPLPIILCQALSPLLSGMITYSPDNTPEFDLGTVATHVCNEGFVLEGVMNRTCEGNGSSAVGMWSDKPPICLAITCPLLPTLENGIITYAPDDTPPDFDLGTVATHVCNEKFVLEGVVNRTCEGNGSSAVGTWSDKPPICLPIMCSILPTLENGVITYAPDNTPEFDLGTVAIHVCNEGFILEGVVNRTCEGNGSSAVGTWSDKPPICLAIMCSALPTLENGVITYAPDDTPPDFDYGTGATHVCNEGLGRLGDMTRTCEGNESIASVNGTWSAKPPICLPILCPALPTLENGAITYAPDDSPEFDFGTVATHVCNEGFGPLEDMTRTCEGNTSSVNGTWSAKPPICLPILCPALPTLENGAITYAPDDSPDFDFGTVATHVCNEGYGPLGATIRTCEGNESSINGTWTDEPPICLPIICPVLPTLENGIITYAPDDTPPDFDLGTVATHVCNEGFVLEGAMTRTCEGDGSTVIGGWSDESPSCAPIQCPALPSVDNGMVNYNRPDSDNYDIGTVATYTCNEGFSALANVSSICELTSNTTAEWTGEMDTWECIATPLVSSTPIIVGSVIGGVGLVFLLTIVLTTTVLIVICIKGKRYEQEDIYEDPNNFQPPLPMRNIPMATNRACDHNAFELSENTAYEMERESVVPTVSIENGHFTDPVEAESSNRTCESVLEVPDNGNPIMIVTPPLISDDGSYIDPGDIEGPESSDRAQSTASPTTVNQDSTNTQQVVTVSQEHSHESTPSTEYITVIP